MPSAPWASRPASSRIWGHSFGAYATSNLITRTDHLRRGRIRCDTGRSWPQLGERPRPDSRNIETGQARIGGSPFDYPERYRSQSAFFRLNEVNTPVLILHGEKDLTILYGEGEMFFYALRQLEDGGVRLLRERRSQPIAPLEG